MKGSPPVPVMMGPCRDSGAAAPLLSVAGLNLPHSKTLIMLHLNSMCRTALIFIHMNLKPRNRVFNMDCLAMQSKGLKGGTHYAMQLGLS